MSSHTDYLLLLCFCLFTFFVLLSLLSSTPLRTRIRSSKPKPKPKGHCPICNHSLYSGEKVHSKQIEIEKTELQNRIRGCVYCLMPGNKRKRSCPVCKESLTQKEVILAISDPKVNRLQLKIKGCSKCFPQGFY